MTRKLQMLALGGVLAAAFLLRIWGLGFGAPYLSNFYIRPDESLIIQPAVELLARRGDPGFYGYPAFMATVCAAVFHAFHAVRVVFHAATGTLAEDFANHVTAYFIAARLVSAVAGTLTVFVVWATARRLASRGALLAAALLAFSPLAVRQAHFATTDTLLGMFCLACINRLVAHTQGGEGRANNDRSLWAAAAFFGLAVGTKYTAGVLLPVLLLTAILTPGLTAGRRVGRVLIAGCIASAAFLAANAWLLLRVSTLLSWFGIMFHAIYHGRGVPGAIPWTPRNALVHMLTPLRHGPGGAAGLCFAAAGVLIALRSAALRKIALPVIAGAFLLAGFLVPAQAVPYRYLVPLLPVLAILAGIGFSALFARRAESRWLALRIATAIALLAPGLLISVRTVRLLAEPDTRTLCGNWIRENVPTGVPVIFLGGPEAEPHVDETRASIMRRIDFAHRTYGDYGGDIVSRLYRLRLRGRVPGPGEGRECYRNPEPDEIPAGTICLVSPSYPLTMAQCDPRKEAAFANGTVIRKATFDGLQEGAGACELEPWDAFFLPYRPLSRVIRPGPGFTVRLISRAAAGQSP
jgi:hypothetical protein